MPNRNSFWSAFWLEVLNRKVFFIAVMVFLGGGLSVVLMCDNQTLHLFLNGFHTSFLDGAFRYLTWLGDGWMAAFVVLWFLFRVPRRHAIFFALSLIVSGVFTQILKHFIFEDVLRPYGVMPDQIDAIAGVTLHTRHSFPSGHATMAFAVFGYLALLLPRKHSGLLFVLAFLAAFSRVYLSQHFFRDIVAGAAIGTVVSAVGFTLAKRLLRSDRWSKRGFRVKSK